MRLVRNVAGILCVLGGLVLAFHAAFSVGARDYVLALASSLAAVAAFRAGVEFVSSEVSE